MERCYRRGLEQVAPPYRAVCAAASGAARRRWDQRLRALALYGSAARGTARRGSDLDLVAILQDAPATWLPRRNQAMAAEDEVLASEAWQALAASPHALATVALRVFDLLQLADTPPLFIDLVEDAVLLHDDGTLSTALDGLRARMRVLGSRRVWMPDGTWYWDLKPDLVPGETFTL